MLKDFSRPYDGMDQDGRKEETKRLQKLLNAQQPLLSAAKIPVVVLVEGWAAAGKGSLGKLLADDSLYNEVDSLLHEGRAAIDDIRETSPITTFSSIFFGIF